MKWNWSATSQMSPPPAEIVHTPCGVSVWLPPGSAPLTSSQLHCAGQPPGGGGADVSTDQLSNVVVIVLAVECELAAMAADSAPGMLSATVDPGTTFQFTLPVYDSAAPLRS